MARYRGKLFDLVLPIKGIQVAVYSLTGAKVDTTITDAYGFYQFNDLPTGTYDLRFYGGGYTSNYWITISVSEEGSNIQYFLQPLDGTVIRGGIGALRVQLSLNDPNGMSPVTEGSIKICKRIADAYVPVSSPYLYTVEEGEIVGSLVLYAVADPGTDKEFIYDSITLADINDAIGWVGWVEATSLITLEDEAGNLSPSSISLSPK